MDGQVKYIGKASMYDFYFEGRCVKFLKDQSYCTLPLQNCRELVQSSNFVPSPETYELLKPFYFGYKNVKLEDSLKGEDCFIVGGGASLKGFDFSQLDGKYTITINHSIFYYPNSKAILFIDRKFIKENNFEAEIFLRKYKGIVFSAFRTKYFLESNRSDNVYSFSLNNTAPQEKYYDGLYHSRSSGLAAVNLALIMKARRIYLLGFDYDYEAPTKHFYNSNGEDKYKNEISYVKPRCNSVVGMFQAYLPYKDRIINCNPESRLPYFIKKPLKEIFPC